MIRRSTWIVFGIFIVVALTAIFLMKSPSSPLPVNGISTPSVTPAPRVIEGWDESMVASLALENSDGFGQQITRNSDGSWTNVSQQMPVEAGKVEQIISELLALRVLTVMPADYSLDALELTSPTKRIIFTSQEGKKVDFIIGKLTPTGNGYYVRIDNLSPVVVSNYAVDGVTQLFADIQATATPQVSLTVEATAAP